jgi:hypothetical protein
MSPQKRVSSPNKTSNRKNPSNLDELPRFVLFDSKAQIEYTPEDDNLAAQMYSDRKFLSPEKQSKPRISGVCEIENMLKGHKTEYRPWG